MHKDDAKTAVLHSDDRISFMYALFSELPVEKKGLKIYTKRGSVLDVPHGLPKTRFEKLVKKELPLSIVLSTGEYQSLRIDSSTVIINRLGSILLNYTGDATEDDVVDYLVKYSQNSSTTSLYEEAVS